MPQAILPRILNNCQQEDDRKSELQIEQYQVDSTSTSSKDYEDSEEETDEESNTNNAIVARDQSNIPHFGKVSVVNSNDVHFGNKTVYKGPVTIKQFVYPNSDKTSENGLNGLTTLVNHIPDVGVINGGFVRDSKDKEVGDVLKEEKHVEREQEANNMGTRIRKGLKWIKTVPCKRPKLTMLCLIILLLSLTIISAVIIWKNPSRVIQIDDKRIEEDNIVPVDYTSDSETTLGKLRIYNRLLWLAQPPSGILNNLTLPVSLVIVHHTATVTCSSQAQCVFQTRHIQTFHMESNGWSDIGYNFVIGGDGAVYEGRNWFKEGAHTLGWNNISIGVAFIGTFNDKVPPTNMLVAFQKLMEIGINLGYLTKEFQVMGARQFSGTESPGKVFYDVIKSWNRWSSSYKPLKIAKT